MSECLYGDSYKLGKLEGYLHGCILLDNDIDKMKERIAKKLLEIGYDGFTEEELKQLGIK